MLKLFEDVDVTISLSSQKYVRRLHFLFLVGKWASRAEGGVKLESFQQLYCIPHLSAGCHHLLAKHSSRSCQSVQLFLWLWWAELSACNTQTNFYWANLWITFNIHIFNFIHMFRVKTVGLHKGETNLLLGQRITSLNWNIPKLRSYTKQILTRFLRDFFFVRKLSILEGCSHPICADFSLVSKTIYGFSC